jgi:hypothetical protein
VDKPRIRNCKEGPEAKIQEAIIDFLMVRGWFVKSTHGNMYQHGFPDLFCCHSRYGIRWIEVKNPDNYCFTAAQLEDFPKFTANGAGVWILTAATQCEYEKLWKPPNWWAYLH